MGVAHHLTRRYVVFSQTKELSMKIVEYSRSLQWVGDLRCNQCNGLTPAWRSSGMSQCFPHFYCDTCSNVIHRASDQRLVWSDKSLYS